MTSFISRYFLTCCRGRIGFVLIAISSAFLLGLPASGAPILSEIYYDAEGSDDGHGFVELAGEPARSKSTFVGGLKTLPLRFTAA